MNRWCMIAAMAVCMFGEEARAQVGAPPVVGGPEVTEVAPDAEQPRSVLGVGELEAGDVVLTGGGGLYFLSLYGLAEVKAGVGGGAFVAARYEALMLLGQAVSGRVGWGGAITETLRLGFVLETGYTTLELADGLFGMDFLSFELGNDWTAGLDLVLGWGRPEGSAQLSFLLGADMTIGGDRPVTFERREFQYEPELRSLNAGVIGEWPLGPEGLNFFIRFDVLLPVATDIIPLGFFPSGAGGVAWAI